MQLCIDAGNTNIKLALFKDRRLIRKFSTKNFDEVLLEELIVRYGPTRAIISSVRKIPLKWHSVLKKKVNSLILSTGTVLPIKLNYKTPGTLGTDRIASAVGAFAKFPDRNCLIINAGTCITFDLIAGSGKYMGGAISPGIEMRYQAMHKYTGMLPYVTNRRFVRNTGRSTEDSINSGVLNHICFEIDGAIEFYNSLYRSLQVIITGGDGPFLAKHLKNSIFAAPDLVLNGLNEILIYNA